MALDQRIQTVGEDLAEARHDVAVTRALIAEEEARLDAINDRRAQILRDHVRFIAYQRPREAELITPAPMRQLDPGCSRRPFRPASRPIRMHPTNLPGCSRWCARPRRWFASVPALLDRLDRVDLLVKTMQTAQLRSQIMNLRVAAQPAAVAVKGVVGAIAALQGKQLAAVQQLRVTSSRIDPC